MMHVGWGALPLVLCAAAVTAGAIWMMRYEIKTGTALRFFVPYEPWSRARNPRRFAARQVMNGLFVVFCAAGTVSFIVLMFALPNVRN